MERIVVTPQYYRGKGAIDELEAVSKKLRISGNNAVIIGGETGIAVVQGKITGLLNQAQINITDTLIYGKECSWENINLLADKVMKLNADFIIGVGGGKALDTAKAVAYKVGIPIVTVPTIAATCAAMTPLSIIHTSEGAQLISSPESALPEAVFVDTTIIAEAPKRLFCSGMGDTLAKWYELRAITGGIINTSLTIGAFSLGRTCYQLIKEFGHTALVDVAHSQVTNSVEQVVDAIIWFAGISSILGGEVCRAAAAHAIYSGFTKIEKAHQMHHGELVGFGNLCLLELEKRPEAEIIESIKLAHGINVPVTIAQIGQLTAEEISLVANTAANSKAMKFMPMKVEGEAVMSAIYAIDQRGKQLLGR
ncbi:MAG: iron-containing alcohol dehydrogenase family protein [Bacillota bacterium]|nr:iron-containing alcohol dehydrogenase family protein [Bacillota bacterium]